MGHIGLCSFKFMDTQFYMKPRSYSHINQGIKAEEIENMNLSL